MPAPLKLAELDAVVVGAGFAGMYMLHRLRKSGFSARAFETGSGVGGTWYWNRYPGARCDVESMEYSYAFSDELQQQWQWTERYPPQPEILRYANHVADRFDLRKDIQFNTRVTAATFDERAGRWIVRTGDGAEISARFVIMATGCLSSANTPDLEGMDTFEGEIYHTGRWPHERVDFTNKRVAVIGTGSSGIQAIPMIAEEAADLVVFQRTPNYSVPARNKPLDPQLQRTIKTSYADFRARNRLMPFAFGSSTPVGETSALDADPDELDRDLRQRWERGGFSLLWGYGDFGTNRDANEKAASFVRQRIREIVRDPAVAERLSPKNVIGCKRLCLDTNYFETFNRPNVHLVDVSKQRIERLTPRGLDVGGKEYPFDCIVFATGFDAMTGSLLKIDIHGRGGMALRDKWSAGPRTYLGLGVAGFPNLFTISGPGSPSVLTNMIVSIEQHVEWIADCLVYLRDRGYGRIEANEQAEDAWVGHVNSVADTTLYPTCNSWYLGSNVPGKTRVFMPLVGFPPYLEKCNEVAAKGYEGFTLEPLSAA
jgi:cation diffusion facilitator CzcD-associated flavoprotein CzcO